MTGSKDSSSSATGQSVIPSDLTSAGVDKKSSTGVDRHSSNQHSSNQHSSTQQITNPTQLKIDTDQNQLQVDIDNDENNSASASAALLLIREKYLGGMTDEINYHGT